jgi:solute carrier family 25 folate transporter 32
VGNTTSWGIFFFFKSKIEDELLLFHHPTYSLDNIRTNPQNALTSIDYAASAAGAGVTTTMATAPIWVLKTRMLSSDRGTAGAYTNMWQGVKHVWATDGLRGFWRGAGISLVGNTHGAVQFAFYDPFKRLWKRHVEGGRVLESGKEEKMGTTATLVISSGSKIVAGTVTYPYQVLRSKLQTYDAEERFGKGIRGVMAKTWRENGWKGFYSGLSPSLVRVLPATWVTFLVYENVAFYLRQRS